MSGSLIGAQSTLYLNDLKLKYPSSGDQAEVELLQQQFEAYVDANPPPVGEEQQPVITTGDDYQHVTADDVARSDKGLAP